MLNIRFKDTLGAWSQVFSQFFEKNGASQNVNNLVTKYEYWFNDDYLSRVTQSITPTSNFQLNTAINMNALPAGLHVAHVRFQDTIGLWSQVVSQFVYKIKSPPSNPNLIVAYRYWVDNDIANAVNVNLSTPTKDFNLNTAVNLVTTPKGARYFNIQFRDTSGLWSVVQTDSFFKTPVPFANFSSTSGNLCDSGTVSFINNSVDADLYHWDFGDGDTSILAAPTHTYASPGSYTVTLLVKDTLANLQDDTIRVGYITIDTLPTVVATASSDTLCLGQSTTLTGTGTATSYTWSNAVVNNQSFVPTNSQMYVVTGANGNCSAQDCIYITVNPLPTLTVNISPNDTVCSGVSTTLSATGAPAITISGPQSIVNGTPFVALNSGSYTIIGTNNFGCSDTVSQQLHVLPLPSVVVGSIQPNDSVCTNTAVTISGSGANTYSWTGP